MKLLLLGKDGQVGRALRPALAPLGDVVALGHVDADFEKPGELARLVATHAPDVIVNAVAYTAVDKAEADIDRARLINAEAVATLAAAAHRSGAWLVHYSTDYVYDGEKPDPYVEADIANPLSVYGSTKHRGDLAVFGSGCRHLIFRIGWVYATGSNNFARAILRLAREREALNVVADQIGAPTSAGLVASVTAAALAKLASLPLQADVLAGLYHLAPQGAVGRHAYAQELVRQATALGANLKLKATGITPIATANYPTPAARPLNSRLDTQKLRLAFGFDLPPWEDDVRQWVKDTVAEGAF
jgi:dTDP-4-dehydrorhamnose reductase